jgi:hypothetical protein
MKYIYNTAKTRKTIILLKVALNIIKQTNKQTNKRNVNISVGFSGQRIVTDALTA